MPFFPELVPPTHNNPPAKRHFKWAKKLYGALLNDITNPPKKGAWKQWVKRFYLLEVKDGIAAERIVKVLDWLTTPEQIRHTKCRSGRMFRSMFEQLEVYSQNSSSKLDPNITLSRMELLHLKHLNNFSQEKAGETLQEAGLILKQHLHRFVDAVEANPKLLGNPSQVKYALERVKQLKFSTVWHSILEEMCFRLKTWKDWDGDLRTPARKALTPNSAALQSHFKAKDLNWSTILNAYKDSL